MNIGQKLAQRAYLATMRIEAMWALGLRRKLVGWLTGRKPASLNIFSHVFIQGFESLKFGRDLSINRDCHLSCAGGVQIGNFVSIGHGTSIISSNHGFSDRDVMIKYQPIEYASVLIGNNVWVGARVTILAGATIADGCIVAAGAVVTRSFLQPDMILAGVPARAIRSRFEKPVRHP